MTRPQPPRPDGASPKAADARTAPLLTAAEVAAALGVSRWFVYDHAGELGAVRLGDGPRAALRFDPTRVAEVRAAGLRSRRSQVAPEPVAERSAPRRRRRRSGTEPDLLPIRAPEVPRGR